MIGMSPITNCFGNLLNLLSLVRVLLERKSISEIFNNFFSSIVAKLFIPKYEDLSLNSVNSEEPLDNLVIKYKNHPSIKAILNKSLNMSFSLKTVSKDVEMEILNLNVEGNFKSKYN